MSFYGKDYGDYELVKGDFLLEDSMAERINSATWVVNQFCCEHVWEQQTNLKKTILLSFHAT